MSEFKKDEHVVCINPMNGLTKGKCYKIIDIVAGYTMVLIIDNTGKRYHFSAKRFISIEEHKEKLRYMLATKTKINFREILD